MDYPRDNRQSAAMQLLNEDYDEVMEYNQRYFEEVGFERGLEQGIGNVAEELRGLGVDELVIERAVAAAKAR